MSAVLDVEIPQTRDVVKFFDKRIVNKQNERWLGSLGDFIDPERKLQLDWARIGGIELNTNCLQRFGNTKGFLPRGYIAPLELGADPMPEEQLRNLGGGQQWAAMVDGVVVTTNLQFLPTYPGEAYDSLSNNAFVDRAAGGIRIGVTEFPTLYGMKWEDGHKPDGSGLIDRMYKTFFPDLKRAATLSGIQAQIKSGYEHDPAFREIGDRWVQSGEEFRRWGMRRVEMENMLLRTGVHSSGHAYQYSPLALLLIDQLELQRQDQPFAELSRLTGEIGRSVQFAMNGSPSQPSGMSIADILELGKKLAQAEARMVAQQEEIESLKADQAEPKEHWKTREAREKREAAEREAQSTE